METSSEVRWDAALSGRFWGTTEGDSALSMEARPGTSRLWRGLDVADGLDDDGWSCF